MKIHEIITGLRKLSDQGSQYRRTVCRQAADALEADGYADGELVFDMGYCPRCRQGYEIEYSTPKYCENCGQALDWRGIYDE